MRKLAWLLGGGFAGNYVKKKYFIIIYPAPLATAAERRAFCCAALLNPVDIKRNGMQTDPVVVRD